MDMYFGLKPRFLCSCFSLGGWILSGDEPDHSHLLMYMRRCLLGLVKLFSRSQTCHAGKRTLRGHQQQTGRGDRQARTKVRLSGQMLGRVSIETCLGSEFNSLVLTNSLFNSSSLNVSVQIYIPRLYYNIYYWRFKILSLLALVRRN